MNDLPDDALLDAFVYFHPIDLIHRLSSVCRSWNNLANDPILFKKVRILIAELSLEYGRAKRFLERVRFDLIFSFNYAENDLHELTPTLEVEL